MITDLTQSYSTTVSGFSAEVAKTMERDGWNASSLHIYSHAGTHMDAPVHFDVGNQTIDELPVDRFMGRAWVVDIKITRDQQLITEADFEASLNNIEAGDSVIVKTGWHQFRNEERYRKGLPRISESLAHWLVSKKINMLVVEPPSVADVNNLDEVKLIHQILFKGGIIIIEGIVNTGALTSDRVHLIALPIKIKRGDGAPARVIAIH